MQAKDVRSAADARSLLEERGLAHVQVTFEFPGQDLERTLGLEFREPGSHHRVADGPLLALAFEGG